MDYNDEGLQEGVFSLVAAMLQLAVQDFKRGPERKDDVEAFLDSEWFIEICEGLGVSSKEVKKRICGENNNG
jgi:myosin heavy subunit